MADIQHKNITGLDAAHPPFYASESDPTTTLGAYRVWFKPSTGEFWVRNAANTAWLDPVASGSGGSAGHTIQDEGSNLTARTNLNFLGAGVTVTDDSVNDQTDVTIPGGTADPASETVAGLIEIATQTEVNTGTDTTRAVTPATLAGRTATETRAGVAEVATQTETNTGTDDARMVTPAKLAGRTASATQTGVVELATDAETQTGTDTTRAITPANLSARTSTETRTGVVELATDAETQTGTDTARVITPANLSARTATETRSGVIEIATQAETDTGTDDIRAVTPAKLANYSGLGVAVEEDGTEEGAGIDRFDFTTGLNVSVTGTQATISATGGGSGIAVEEDGSSEGTGIDTLNFSTGLDVSVSGAEATISATGGGGGGDMLILANAEVSITGTTTLTSSAFGKMHVCSGTSSDYTVTLPAASSHAGELIGFRMASGLTKLVTLDGNSSETIDGSTTRVMWAQESAILLCDGSNWTKIAGKFRPMRGEISYNLSPPENGIGTSSGSYSQVPLNTSIEDNTAVMVETASNRLVIKRPGTYTVNAQVGWDSISTTVARLLTEVRKNGTNTLQGEAVGLSGSYAMVKALKSLSLAAGDLMTLYALSSSGQGIYASSASTFMSIIEEVSW